jgi:hypothetical protein
VTDSYRVTLFNPVQGYPLILEAWKMAKSLLIGGHRVTLILRPETRSEAQNRRYWGKGVLHQIAEQATVGGRKYAADVWHEENKRRFLGVMEMPDGSVVGKSTTNLTKAQFSDFCTQVEAWASTELGVHFDQLEEL